MQIHRFMCLAAAAVLGCFDPTPTAPEPPPGVVFTYPVDRQRDVPLGARVLVSFSAPVAADAACTVVGPGGTVEIATQVMGSGHTLAITSRAFEPATTYAVHSGDESTPLFSFTTRNDRPRSGAPALVAFNGSDPVAPGTFRPIFETSTLSLVFSEPLDPRTVVVGPGGIELVDPATRAAQPVTLVANGIHV
jgi:hypothetical protein